MRDASCLSYRPTRYTLNMPTARRKKVSSRVYPGLERKAGGPDNWVEQEGNLPPYIERIAKHLHYEQGRAISAAIATAINTVKRWARGGTVTKTGTTQRVTKATQAKAAKALADLKRMQAAARARPNKPGRRSGRGRAG